MPRAIVTAELADILRSIRIQNKIQAKSLAQHIGKSPAYISKLESGNIQTIDNQLLYSILQFISGSQGNSNELAEQIYASLKFKYSSKEIEEQVWFINYDTVERKLPIPESLIDYINSRIKSLDISYQYLSRRINANEALSPEELNDDNIECNHWYHHSRIEGGVQSIKIDLPESTIKAILSKEIDVSPYVFIFCILFYVLKIEEYGDKVALSDNENSTLMKMTTEILNNHKFFSISEKESLAAEKQTKEDLLDLLSSFDKDNIDIINDIIAGFRFASEYNIKSTNEQLSSFSQNMHWDLGFMLRIISMDFKSLSATSVSNRKNLISSIEKLLTEYAQMPKEQNRIENY